MALNKAYNQYKENSIYTSTSEELTLMLYNGLVRFVMQAQHALKESNLEKANASMIRAQDIILHFRNTLNMKYEISNNLALIYDYLYTRLLDANIKKDIEILDEVLFHAKELRDTWIQAIKIAKGYTNASAVYPEVKE